MSALRVVQLLQDKGVTLVPVESCTGGSLMAAITDIPGASGVLADGFVTYSNEAKIMLGVPAQVIVSYSVYSLETAREMAKAGIRQSVRASLGIGITGSLSRLDPANPSSSKVGEVFIALVKSTSGNLQDVARACIKVSEMDRVKAKQQVVSAALQLLEVALMADLPPIVEIED
jgi:PncC family amidohydrolase